MMNKTLEIVNLVLATADLMDLIEITGNENEYHPESAKIAEYIDNDNPDVDSLAKYIRQVFVSYFGECFDLEVCEMVADCILKNLED